jgi:predicted amidohydrolase
LVCYDLRFPYCSWNDTDYDVLLYAANWPTKRINQWNALLQARAIENQAYTIGVNRLGADKNNLSYNGQSKAYDFLGNVVLDCKEETNILSFTLDKKALDEYRIKLPFLNDQK